MSRSTRKISDPLLASAAGRQLGDKRQVDTTPFGLGLDARFPIRNLGGPRGIRTHDSRIKSASGTVLIRHFI